MKVYVIKHLLICDYEIMTNEVQVYKNRVKAVKTFKSLVREATKLSTEAGWDISINEEDSFEAGRDGYYAQDAEYLTFSEQELL